MMKVILATTCCTAVFQQQTVGEKSCPETKLLSLGSNKDKLSPLSSVGHPLFFSCFPSPPLQALTRLCFLPWINMPPKCCVIKGIVHIKLTSHNSGSNSISTLPHSLMMLSPSLTDSLTWANVFLLKVSAGYSFRHVHQWATTLKPPVKRLPLMPR